MNEARRNTLVGVFVLAGLAALGGLIVLFGQRTLLPGMADGYVIHVVFDSASGIRDGTLATIGGVTVARVDTDGVKFVNPNNYAEGVRVTLRFDPGYMLREGASASTVAPGLGMGRPPIVLNPGDPQAPVLASGAIIRGQMSSMVESIIPPSLIELVEKTGQRLGQTAEALDPVLADLHELLRPRGVAEVDVADGPPGNLSSASARLDAALKHINEVLGDPQTQDQLKASIENIHSITEDGKVVAADLKSAVEDARTLVASGRESLAKLDERLDRLTRNFMTDLELAADLLTKLNTTAEAMNRTDGTVGRLMNDPRLYEEATLTFRRLTETVEEMRALVRDVRDGKVPIRLGL